MPVSKIMPEPVKESSASGSAPPAASRMQLAAAFAAVYIIWGSTYLAIRIGITEIPPFFLAGARYLITSAILYPLARARSAERPTRQHWVAALLLGALLPAAGNGFLTWAEQTVPSGIAALLVTTVSLWMVILEWVRPGGTAPTARTSVGLLLGFGGILLLVAPWQSTGRVNLIGAGVLMTGSLCWPAASASAAEIGHAILLRGDNPLCVWKPYGGSFTLAIRSNHASGVARAGVFDGVRIHHWLFGVHVAAPRGTARAGRYLRLRESCYRDFAWLDVCRRTSDAADTGCDGRDHRRSR